MAPAGFRRSSGGLPTPGREASVQDVRARSFHEPMGASTPRLGYAQDNRGRDVLASALKFGQARLCPPELGQIVAEAALETPKEYFEEVYNEYIARRDFMVQALNSMPGVYCPMPRGAFYTVVKLPIDDSDRFAQWLLQDFSFNNQTVMIAPATGFYFTPGAGKNEARVAYVLKIDDLRKAMETLAEALKVYPGRVG